MKLLVLSIAPIMVGAIYMYIRDKYEKEPIRLLLIGLIYGIIITAPIVHTENFVTLFVPNRGVKAEALYLAFIVASLVEESYKYIILFFLVWRNGNFNERFDGIVYAVFISLGFAGLENIMYVFNPSMGGVGTALTRALFSVPGHALFGVAMGYYFALAKFEPQHRIRLALYALFVPFMLHGIYDFILMADIPYMMVAFIPFVAYLWVAGFHKMKYHIQSSPFKTK